MIALLLASWLCLNFKALSNFKEETTCLNTAHLSRNSLHQNVVDYHAKFNKKLNKKVDKKSGKILQYKNLEKITKYSGNVGKTPIIHEVVM